MSYPRESFWHKLRELLVIRHECDCGEQPDRRIVTSKVLPPIPSRSFDWCATFDGYEPGCPIGHGETEQEAIDNLLESEES